MFHLLIILIKSEILIEKDGPYESSQILYAGQYIFQCYGAQGADGFYASPRSIGGKGAYVKGTYKITGEGTQVYINVGGKPSSSAGAKNPGGFNGGGAGGKQNTQSGGGGGGATDVRIKDNQLNHRIIVAAGGSGGCGTKDGAPGGDFRGRYYNNDKLENSTLTSQTEGNEDGVGGDGKDTSGWFEFGGSGGGGGWRGGVSTGVSPGISKPYQGVAHSGSSFISGYGECITIEDIIFNDPYMEVGNKEGNGKLIISYDYLCSENCADCSDANTCTKCFTNFYHYENKCYNPCPEGTREAGDICEKCLCNCASCPSSKDICDKCSENFFLYEGKCYDICPEGTREAEYLCEKCNDNCLACSSSKDICDSCEPGYHLYEYKCYNPCPEGTREEKDTCEKCPDNCLSCSSSKDICDICNHLSFKYDDKCYVKCSSLNQKDIYFGNNNQDKVCQKCKDSNCIDCSNDYLKCNKCTELYYPDSESFECILKPTDKFTDSSTFTSTSEFTSSSTFTEPLPVSPTNDETTNICETNNRCEIVKNETEYFAKIAKSDFINITFEGDGGAIHFINCGIKCDDTNFINCSSTIGGGGGIYIYLIHEISEQTSISGCTFKECKAVFGGGVFAFSNVMNNMLSITKCNFISNEIIDQSTLPNQITNEYYGGSAIFMNVKKSKVIRCKFLSNVGKESFKILNNFDTNVPKDTFILEQKFVESFISIFQCDFEIDSSSSCSLYFVRGIMGAVPVDVTNCTFRGDVKNNSYHIDGTMLSNYKNAPKLLVKSCKFSTDKSNSLNLDSKHAFASFDINQQIFNYKEIGKNDHKIKNKISIIKFSIPIVFVEIILLVLFKNKLPYIANNNDALNVFPIYEEA